MYGKGYTIIEIFVLQISFSMLAANKQPGCITIFNDTYENCTHVSPDFLSRGKKMHTICRESQERKNSTHQCMNNEICSKTFNLSIFHNQLFAITMKDAVLNMLNHCCGSCAKCAVVKNLEYITDIKPPSMNPADIIFPVLGYASSKTQHGYHFLPTYDVPSSYYLILKQSNKEMVMKVIGACIRMWPLIIISLLMALISGFITWSVETCSNDNEFPRPFLTGLFEGFWWSFITMTTVGYGDKCPKSYFGRIFAVVWIFIGINVCGTFSAALTNEIMTFRSHKNTGISGKKVGVLKHRLHDATIVSQQGGVLIEGKFEKTVYGIVELIDMLYKQQIDGFLINRNTYYYFTRRIKAKKYRNAAHSIRDVDMIKIEKFLEGEKLSSGILIKKKTEYEYFKALYENNRLSQQACNSVKMNYKRTATHEDEINLFSPEGGVFELFLSVCLSILGIVFAFGLFYEIRRVLKRRQFKFVQTFENTLKEISKINISVAANKSHSKQKKWELEKICTHDVGHRI